MVKALAQAVGSLFIRGTEFIPLHGCWLPAAQRCWAPIPREHTSSPCLLRSPSGQYQGLCTIPVRPSHVTQHSYFSSSMVHSMGCFEQRSVDMPSTSPCVRPWFLLSLSGLGKVRVPSAEAFPPFAESREGFLYASCKLHTQGGWRGSCWPVIPFVGMKF